MKHLTGASLLNPMAIVTYLHLMFNGTTGLLWFICLIAQLLFMGYLMLKFDSLVNDYDHNYILNNLFLNHIFFFSLK